MFISCYSKKIGASRRIPALKPLLAAYSPVFERLFYGYLKEFGDVAITDVSAEAFEEFLQFFYSNEFNLRTDNLPEVFKLIDKYDTAALRSPCERYLAERLSVNVAYVYYELAIAYDLPTDLVKRLERMIRADPKRALIFGPKCGSNRDVLANILQSNKLKCREIDVFEGAMSWAKTSSEIKRNGTINRKY